jgi:FixJ family two-component response regulator
MHHRVTMRALERRYESLSRREREVMSLVVAGRLNKQVGGELGISEITVKAHRGKLMRKMQAKSFAELINMALSLGETAPTATDRAGRSHALAGAGRDFHALEAGHY